MFLIRTFHKTSLGKYKFVVIKVLRRFSEILCFVCLDKAEIVFLSIFVIEMLLKIYGLGPSMYFRSTFNTFDFVVSIFNFIK